MFSNSLSFFFTNKNDQPVSSESWHWQLSCQWSILSRFHMLSNYQLIPMLVHFKRYSTSLFYLRCEQPYRILDVQPLPGVHLKLSSVYISAWISNDCSLLFNAMIDWPLNRTIRHIHHSMNHPTLEFWWWMRLPLFHIIAIKARR